MAPTESAKDAGKDPAKLAPARNLKEDSLDDRAAVPRGKEKFLPTGLSRAIVLASIVIGVAICGTLLFADRYDLVPAPNSANGFMYRIDRLTGAVQFCGPQGCSPLPQPSS